MLVNHDKLALKQVRKKMRLQKANISQGVAGNLSAVKLTNSVESCCPTGPYLVRYRVSKMLNDLT